MLSIRLDSSGKFLDLFSDASIQVTLTNPLFSQSVSDGSYLFSFKIPNTPVNSSLLGFPGRITKNSSVYKIKLPCSLFWKFHHWKAGSLVVTSASPKNIEIQIGVDESALLSENADKMLPSFFEDDITYMGADRFDITDFINALVNKSYPETRFCWPMFYNPPSVKNIRDTDLGAEYESSFPYCNYFAQDTFLHAIVSPTGKNLYTLLSPQLFIPAIFDKLFDDVSFDSNIFKSDSELAALFLFNTHICNYLHTTAQNDGRTMMPYGYLHANDFLPNVSATDFLSALLSMFNAKLISSGKDSFSIVSAESLLNAEDIRALRPGSLGGISDVDVENSVSEYSFSMKQINDGFQNNDIKSTEKYNIFGYVNTFTDLAALVGMKYSDICYVVDRNVWFAYTYDEVSFALGWQLFSKNFPYTFNRKQWWDGLGIHMDPDYSLSTDAGTILFEGYFGSHVDQVDPAQRVLKIPSLNIESMVTGMYETYDDRFEDIAFLFYRGLRKPPNSNHYFPMACHDNFFNGVKIGDYSLAWDGEYGLFEKFHRPLFDFLKGSVLFKASLNLSDTEIFNLDITKKYFCDNIQFFFKKIDFTISGSSVKNIKAECYRI